MLFVFVYIYTIIFISINNLKSPEILSADSIIESNHVIPQGEYLRTTAEACYCSSHAKEGSKVNGGGHTCIYNTSCARSGDETKWPLDKINDFSSEATRRCSV